MSDVENMFASELSRFVSFYFAKTTHFAFLSFFRKHDLELKISLRVRIWIEKDTTCQILEQNFHNASDFGLKVLQGVRFLKKVFRLVKL